MSVIPTIGLSRGGGGGIARAMVEVTVGNEMASALYPKYAPRKTKGIETQHHIAATMMTSKRGAEAEDFRKKR